MNEKTEYKSIIDSISSDPEMKSCFESLPQMVRESILMSGAEITSAQQLRALADNLMKKDR